MLTQCPGCQTIFRVTGAVLKVAHGQVRCGKCSTQFDALECMLPDDIAQAIESSPDQEVASTAEPKAVSTEQIVVEEPESHEEITLEGKRIEISGVYRVLDGGDDPEHPHTRTFVEEFEFNDGDEEESVSTDDLDSLLPAGTAGEQPPAEPSPVSIETGGLSAARRAITEAQNELRASTISQQETITSDFQPRRNRPRNESRTLWMASSVVLGVILLIQTLHHYRQELARHPKLGSWIIGTYSMLGVPLTPNWDLRAYDLQQWGVVSDPATPGTLRVRAGVTNRGLFAQPYPLLRLVLEDRWGMQIGSREFEPREYLPSSATADRMLAPKQAANVEIAIVDPGEDAVGFHVDVCLRRDSGLSCAGDESAG